jgi:DNA-binding FrmR family transcriptional regulator
MTHTRIEMDTMNAIERMEGHLNRIANVLERLEAFSNVLERLEAFFVATSVEEVQKRVEDMHNGKS